MFKKTIILIYIEYDQNYSNEEMLNKLEIYFESRRNVAIAGEIYVTINIFWISHSSL